MPEIQFALVAVGRRFFDPVSGDDFEKTSAATANHVVEQEVADFEGHEVVVVYEEEQS